VATDGELSVVLHTELTDALVREGIAREFTSLMQNARREAGLEVSDRIKVSWSCADATVAQALREHAAAVAKEILAVELNEGAGTQSFQLNDVEVRHTLTRA
jgi:isoleucyl-tRNA synthetase